MAKDRTMKYIYRPNFLTLLSISLALNACGLDSVVDEIANETTPDTSACVESNCQNSEAEEEPGPITDWAGDLEVNMNSDVDFMANLQTISGNLNIGPGLDIALPKLVSIDGDLIITSNDAILTLSLENLETIGGNLELRINNRMTTLNLPKLSTVAMGVLIVQNRSLQTINIDSLISSGLSCSVTNNNALQALNMNSFTTAGLGLEIKDNESLASCLAQSIGEQLTSGSATISGNDSTATCDD